MSRRSDSGLDGILLIDKPAGWTSHDVVAKVRSLTGQRRIGHTGTLDPMATGLLVLCLGAATRLVEYMIGADKRYTGVIALGTTTSTDDADGAALVTRAVPPLDAAQIEEVVGQFRGRILQRPPAVSAIKVGGVRGYEAARRGESLELQERPVTIDAFTASVLDAVHLKIDVTCSSGTYIRSLARDIGETLGCGAHLSALRREVSGPFGVSAATTLASLAAVLDEGRLDEFLLPVDEGIVGLPAALLGHDGTSAVTNGRVWHTPDGAPARELEVRIYSDAGEFAAVGFASISGEIRARKVFLRAKSSK